jgi:hypothetical protein
MRLVDYLEQADLAWCAIGGVAVSHWAVETMVTQHVDFVVAAESVELATKLLEEAGFRSERSMVNQFSGAFEGQHPVEYRRAL